MGRGRAKAKQTKVARRLKYSGPDTDLQALEAELKGPNDLKDSGDSAADVDAEHDTDDYDAYEGDPYPDYDEDDDEPRP